MNKSANFWSQSQIWLLKISQSVYQVELSQNLLIKDIIQPIYDKFSEHARENEIDFEINKSSLDDLSLRIDKDGINLILTAMLQNAFIQSKSKEQIEIVISHKQLDEAHEEISLSILQYRQNTQKRKCIFDPYYHVLDSKCKVYYPNLEVCKKVAQ